jgi:hypothetical protein
MTRLTVFVAAAATAAVAMISTAEARDGCGRGAYFNGHRCVSLQGHYGRYDPGSYYAPNFGGNAVRPTRGRNGAISCSNPNYTWQDGACKPYRGG